VCCLQLRCSACQRKAETNIILVVGIPRFSTEDNLISDQDTPSLNFQVFANLNAPRR